MVDETFFEDQTEASKIKTIIVSKYFPVWAKIILPQAKKYNNDIAYIDLFSGPGLYDDGSKSTPLIILEKIIADEKLCKSTITIFNDSNPDFAKQLEVNISKLPSLDKLKHQPQICDESVGDEIAKRFGKMKMVPALSFIDPWGYKGLSLDLVASLVKSWACECIMFFNYRRINMALSNNIFKKHMDVMFGTKRADDIREKLPLIQAPEREAFVLEEVAKAIQSVGVKYVLPFLFKTSSGSRTSHYLIFMSKNFLGYDIMKGIMANESSSTEQGVPSFEYNLATERQPLLFSLSRPLDKLEGMLLDDLAGQILSVKEIYETHSVGKKYILKNYKEILKKMEESGKITVEPERSKRRRVKGEPTLADSVKITFPKKM